MTVRRPPPATATTTSASPNRAPRQEKSSRHAACHRVAAARLEAAPQRAHAAAGARADGHQATASDVAQGETKGRRRRDGGDATGHRVRRGTEGTGTRASSVEHQGSGCGPRAGRGKRPWDGGRRAGPQEQRRVRQAPRRAPGKGGGGVDEHRARGRASEAARGGDGRATLGHLRAPQTAREGIPHHRHNR